MKDCYRCDKHPAIEGKWMCELCLKEMEDTGDPMNIMWELMRVALNKKGMPGDEIMLDVLSRKRSS